MAARRRRSPRPGWVVSRVAAPSRGAWLEVHHRPGDERWVSLAPAYWAGTLDGLGAVPSSRHAAVHRAAVPPDGLPCFFKRFRSRGRLDAIKHLVRASRARRAWLRGEEVQALGFLAPRTLCLIEERRRGRTVGGALVSEAVEGATSVWDLVHAPRPEVDTGRAALLSALGRAVGRWHAAGLYHGDLTPRNLLCRRDGAAHAFYWLDNEGVRRFAALPFRLRVRNLVQLGARRHGLTAGEWRCLALAYVRAAGLSAAGRRRLLRTVRRELRRRRR